MDLDETLRRCAIYTRKSTGNRLEAETNSLTTQREVCSAYISSQRHKAWVELPQHYDDGGQSGGDLDRPALGLLMKDIEDGRIDTVVVYKVDRLTRSLVDFVRLVDLFDQRRINLVSISQAFDTSDSMGRMVLNILLTFAQFEREMIAERVRDSLRARKRSGKIHGGKPPFGYQIVDDALVVDAHEAEIVRFIYDEFVRTERYIAVQRSVQARGYVSSLKSLRKGGVRGGTPISSTIVYSVLQNPVYVGEIPGHDGNYPGKHAPIISRETWEAAAKLVVARRKPQPHAKNTEHFLAGLLRDELGRPMYLDIQTKNGRTFTFYASVDAHWARQHFIKAYRCHASRFDKLVVSAIQDFLDDRIRLREALKKAGTHSRELERLAALGPAAGERLGRADLPKAGGMVRALVSGIELGRETVSVTLRPFELKRFLLWDDRTAFRGQPKDWPLTDATYEFTIEVRVVSPEKWCTLNVLPRDEKSASQPDQRLIDLIYSARDAQRLVDTHRHLSIPQLAKKRGMRASQFARLIRINYLAPDIVAAILDGLQPEDCTRKRLLHTNLPTDWRLQRQVLGFPQPVRDLPKSNDKGLWLSSGAKSD